ncbi:MAG: HD-GYP domain-containing protein [Myxococcaceae bacterium]
MPASPQQRAMQLTPRLAMALIIPVLSMAPFGVIAAFTESYRWGWLAGGLAAGLLSAGLVLRVLRQRLAEPLNAIAERSIELAQGRFGVQADVKAPELSGLVKTFNYMSSQLFAYAEENRRLYETLEDGYLETIVSLANSLDSKDPYTRGHSQRVGELAAEIGTELKLPDRELKLLRYGGILHDIGKIGIMEGILHKQSRLTTEEMTVMREHPMIGDNIVGPVRFLSPVRAAVRHHHEWFDGTGYPDKLSGDNIPLIARIIAVADTYDACTSTRPYQQAMPIVRALDVCRQLCGTQLDPSIVNALERIVTLRSAPVQKAS